MNKLILTLLLLSFSLTVSAKKVKFAVDMTGQTLSPNGIHISSDFQTLAGFPGGDWQSNTTPLIQEDTTSIYSIIVDIPAFAKYEYKIVNGDQFYEVEFVPIESRVGYYFNDNRWIYVDSLADDTTFVGAILFAGNAPAGLKLVRYLVDMQNLSIAISGAHIAGDFQGWNPATTYLYCFGFDTCEIISYVTPGTYNYKFYNGNTVGDAETVPVACAVNGNRQIQVTSDTVLQATCFNACVPCALTGINGNINLGKPPVLYPNPAEKFSLFTFKDNQKLHYVYMTDPAGRLVRTYPNCSGNSIEIKRENLETGVYFLNCFDAYNRSSRAKLIFE